MATPSGEQLTANPLRPQLKAAVFLPPGRWPTVVVPVDSDNAIDTAAVQRILGEQGVQVTTINPHEKPWNPLGNSNPYYRGLDVIRTIQVLLTQRNADAIVVVFESGGVFLLLLRRLFWFKPKVILWDASVGNPWRVVTFIQRIVLKRFDGLMMLTTRQMDALRGRHHVRGPLLHLGYNVDEMFFHPRHNTDGDYILSVGDDRSRDYETLWKSLQSLSLKVKLKTRWRPSDIDSTSHQHVDFLSGRLSDREFRGLYAAARFVVLPLHDVESAGGITALFEAMAMGKAVIVTASGISTDFVIDGFNAVVVPRNDATALTNAIQMLHTNPQLCESLGRNARVTIEERFSTRILVEKMTTFIVNVISPRGSVTQ